MEKPYKNHLTESSSKRWVNWKFEVPKGGKEKTKVPYHPKGYKASTNKEATWSTFEEATRALKSGTFDGVGFVFNGDYLGIDLDHVLADGKFLDLKSELLVQEAKTYIEYSPSKTGIHIIFKLDGEVKLTTNKHVEDKELDIKYEVYIGGASEGRGRYFTYTNNPHELSKKIRTIDQAEAERLLAILGYPWDKEDTKDLLTQAPEVHTKLDDHEVLTKMFASRNGDKIKRLYDGDISDYSNDESSADSALCCHLAFWTGKDAEQIDRIWLRSQLGSRKKTQGRPDYRRTTIANAIKVTKEVYTPPVRLNIRYPFLVRVTKDGEKVVCNMANIAIVLRMDPAFKDCIRFDRFKNAMEIRESIAHEWRKMEDVDAVNIQGQIAKLFPEFLMVSKVMVQDAITLIAYENAFDSAQEYIKSLVWDGKPRVDTWLVSAYGTPDDVYHRAVGSNWLKGLAKRITEPGCKFDYVLVLEGPQGIRKSSSLAALVGEWHVETTMNTDTKDFFTQMAGKAVVEFSEGETLSKSEVKKLKAIITTQIDTFRPPYGRVAVDFPRRIVFAMTTNQEQYLKDETGNRRWLPVRVRGKANVDWVKENREQLLAEAYARVKKGETVYEFPQKEMEQAQEMRRIQDEWEVKLEEWYFTILTPDERNAGISTLDGWVKGINTGAFIFVAQIDTRDSMRIANIFANVLHLERHRTMVNGMRTYRYFATQQTYDIAPEEVKKNLSIIP